MSKRIGDEIKDIVQNAVNSRDFRQLNEDIGNTVNSALDEVRNAISNAKEQGNRYYHNYNNRRYDGTYHTDYGSKNSSNYTKEKPYKKKAPAPARYSEHSLIPNIAVGRVSSILLTVFGSIGFGLSGIAIFTLLIIGQLMNKFYMLGMISLDLLPVVCISLFMMASGSFKRKRLKRFRRYLNIFQNRSYYTLKDLSSNIGANDRFILKDLKKMISIGMFPEGHIDEQETCIILNNESYHQYLDLQKNMQNRQKEEAAAARTNATKQKEDIQSSELKSAISAGMAYMEQIKTANEAIPGEEISKKLDSLATVVGKIFDHVKQHPSQLQEIQKFMDYYLPTTLKLVNTYKDFDSQPLQGDNITSAKKEIENTLDTINLAFEKLFDNLFSDAAMDVSTDISVLEMLLAQEGLTKKDFNMKQTMGGKTK